MCIFCSIMYYIWDNFWSIAQTILAWYAIYKAVLIAEEQIKISKYQAKLWEIQSLLSDIQIWWCNIAEQREIMHRIEDIFDSLTLKEKQKAFEDAKQWKETLDTIIEELLLQQKKVKLKQDELDSMNIY